MYYNCFTVCMLVLRRVDRLYHHLFFQLTIERINIRVVRLPNLILQIDIKPRIHNDEYMATSPLSILRK